MKRNQKCRHSGTWLIAGGAYEWCYGCGAIRNMREIGIASCTPESPWCSPVGVGGKNPWTLFNARRTSYQQRRAKVIR